MIAKDKVFTPQTKLADMVDSNPGLLEVFARMGIALGFGESSVADAARSCGLDADTVCLICNVYSFDSYEPSEQEIAEGHITDVVKYIRNSHKSYLSSELVRLEDSISALIVPLGEKLRKVIWRFFGDYRSELEKHFAFEEDEVLPYIQDLLFERDTHGFTISQFADNHSNIDEKLSDLINLVMKTLPRECDAEGREELLRLLFRLRSDLRGHTLVEDKLLTPMARRIEHPTPLKASASEKDAAEHEALTQREKDILVSVARGMLNKEIADEHNISIHTVITHRKNITRKTGIKTVAGLTVYALLNGLIDINTVE